MEIAIGIGEEKQGFEAGKEAAKQAFKKIAKPNLVILFSSVSLDIPDVLRGVREIFKDCQIIGCSSSKEIAFDRVLDNSCVLMAISSSLTIKTGVGRDFSKDARKAGEELANSLIEGVKEPRGTLFLFSDGVSGNGTQMVKGIYNVLGPYVHLLGGAAGDNCQFLKTYQIINDEVLTDSIVAALVLSDTPIAGVGIKHGFTPYGDPMVITKAEGNRIHQLDGKPAFDAYISHFKFKEKIEPIDFRKIEETHTHPLGSPQMREEYLIRHFVCANPDRSIVCSAELPENSVVRVMKATKDSLISSASFASKEALASLKGKKAKAVHIFNCISRVWILNDEAGKEIDEVKKVFGEDVPLFGFYTFGEIGQLKEGPPLFHNKTIVVCAII
ncbi:MAG: FIST N-terminal domain-containing protein [bacterium]